MFSPIPPCVALSVHFHLTGKREERMFLGIRWSPETEETQTSGETLPRPVEKHFPVSTVTKLLTKLM